MEIVCQMYLEGVSSSTSADVTMARAKTFSSQATGFPASQILTFRDTMFLAYSFVWTLHSPLEGTPTAECDHGLTLLTGTPPAVDASSRTSSPCQAAAGRYYKCLGATLAPLEARPLAQLKLKFAGARRAY